MKDQLRRDTGYAGNAQKRTSELTSPTFCPIFQPVQWVQKWLWWSRAHETGCWCNFQSTMKPCSFTVPHLPSSSFPVSLELTLKIQNISRYKQIWFKKKLPARKVLSPSKQAALPCTVFLASGNLFTVRMFKSNVLQDSVLNLSLYCPEQERQASLKRGTFSPGKSWNITF